MDHRRLRSTNRYFLLALGCVLVMGSYACRPGRNSSGGNGGTGGQGSGGNGGAGGSENGGSGGNGTGGSESGGSGGEASGGVEGSGGSTGTSPSCKDNTECTNPQVCDTGKGLCVECVKPADCGPGQGCVANVCVARGDGGPLSPDTPPAECTTATANPCTGIPKLNGTQTVDGKGDDMCSVPSFQFTAAAAAKKVKYNRDPNEEVTARVAWSSAGLSFFADVKDPSVQAVSTADSGAAINKAYQGDSLEIFFSSSNNVTGLTGTDNNTLHVIVPATGPAVSVKTSNSSGSSAGTHTALPTTQYRQATTSTGWAVELLLPWPGGAASAGTTIRFDMALNSADTTFTNADDMRDGQMMYYIGQVSNSTCKSNDGTVPFCDDRTWCETKLQ
jgi:hypothetical protein